MAGLQTYHRKRRFGVTREPRGRLGRGKGHAFVIQKHDARRLHYDLRLELDGVMKSWAVTRGPSLVPGEKRLAVQVEDHPIDYNKFEGTIPQGEYGGGTVMIWDRGTWEPDGDPHRGLAKGHLSFHLDGEKLHGGWHLVRMHRRPGEKRDNWLLIKQTDESARSTDDEDILEEEPRSVTTGRDLDEIAAGKPKKRKSRTASGAKTTRSRRAAANRKKTAKKSARTKTRAAASKKKAAKTSKRTVHSRAANMRSMKRTASRRRSKAGTDALADTPRGALPRFAAPALATLVDKAPSGTSWIHEIKFDGYRIQARLDDGKVKLLTRKGLDWTAKFPTVATAIAKLPARTALIDGELVSEDTNGISSFSLLQQDLKQARHDRMVYYAFDLLHLDGADVRKLPLHARKAALEKLLAKTPKGGPLHFSESLTEPGPSLFKHACQMGLEGIVSKLADAPYRPRRGHDWLKTKCADRQEFVIAGLVPSTADAHAVGALVLGVYDDGKLRYAGRTGTGFTHEVARSLYRRLKPTALKKPSLDPVPKEERGRRGPIWVEPKTVVEVDFHGWTHGDRVRQASFQGVREDKPAVEVVRETKKSVTAAANATTETKRSAPVRRRGNAPAMAGKVKLTHPDRVYWDDVGVTKQDLADYYGKVWEWMRPHVVGRALALVRCPEGAEMGQCFFQKHARAGVPTEFLHLVPEKGDKIISIDDLDGLIALVQGGALEIHIRGSTIDDRERADRLVFDLDPGPGTGWPEVVAAAREVRDRLQQIKLKSFVKTSGGKGLHVVVPIKPEPWDKAKKFTKIVAESMAKDDPDRYLATATKARRNSRIFVDYLRNSREATAVAPYSTRARAGAPVAVPVDWSELGSLKSAHQYTVQNVMQRLGRLKKDPWVAMARVKQALPEFN